MMTASEDVAFDRKSVNHYVISMNIWLRVKSESAPGRVVMNFGACEYRKRT